MSTSTFAVAQQRWALDPGALRPLFESYFDHLVSRGYRESSTGSENILLRAAGHQEDVAALEPSRL